MKLDQQNPNWTNLPLLLAYVAELELEVDRLRQHSELVHQEMVHSLKQLRKTCQSKEGDEAPPDWASVEMEIQEVQGTLAELKDLPGYHPAHDQVIAIAVKPLIERIFAWQKRVEKAENVTLRFELEIDYVEWFPARLRHVLDNLISNALRYRDSGKPEAYITVGLRASTEAYEFRVADNGVGMESSPTQLLELFIRSTRARQAGPGVGLSVVKMLVEQSNGTLTVESEPGVGTTFLATLPRYEIDDYLL